MKIIGIIMTHDIFFLWGCNGFLLMGNTGMTMPISQNSLFIWEKHGKTDGFGAGHILGKPRIEGNISDLDQDVEGSIKSE